MYSAPLTNLNEILYSTSLPVQAITACCSGRAHSCCHCSKKLLTRPLADEYLILRYERFRFRFQYYHYAMVKLSSAHVADASQSGDPSSAGLH